MQQNGSWLDLTAIPAINFATQQNHVPVIRNVMITNTGISAWPESQLAISATPEFAKPYTQTIPALQPGECFEIKIIPLAIAPQFLADLTERMLGTLGFSLNQENLAIHSLDLPIDILPFDHWGGLAHLPEMIAALCTPNHPEIPRIIRRAAAILQDWTGSPSFDEYQSKNPNRVRKQIAAIYEAIAEENLVYCSVPASFEMHGQRVRLADAILKDRLANCLDLSLLLAACLEAVGIHPLLIFVKGHAFAGAWLVEESFPDAVNDDPSLLTKRTVDGINEIVLVEATAMNAGHIVPFDAAVQLANQKMAQPDSFHLFVDLKRARFGGIRPLPLRIPTATGWTIEEEAPKEREHLLPEDLSIGPKVNHVSRIDTTRQQIWERKLLDLSLRNSLLNIRLTKTMVQFITTSAAALEDGLADGIEYQVLAKPLDWDLSGRDAGLYQAMHQSDPLADLVNHEFSQRRLRTYLSEAELWSSLTQLYRASRLAIEENGANTLYVGLGLLKWFETLQSKKPRYAPILLIPVEIIRKTSHQGFIIRTREEETIINITLLEMLRQDFGISIGIDTLPRDEQGIDVRAVFNIIRQSIMAKSRWDVEEQAILGTFSFSKFILWNDLHNNAATLQQHRLVASLLGNQLSWQPEPEITAAEIQDPVLKPDELALPISTDSSQLQAILSAAKGRSFVLHGPPGTGKSQTITNIIAQALFSGKRVLFVAAKKAALEVVEHRLESIGVGPFCLELHSNKARKSAVLDQLKLASQVIRKKAPETFQLEANRLYELRAGLHQYIEVLHQQQPFGYSLFDLITLYSQQTGGADTVNFPASAIAGLSIERRLQWEDRVKELQAAGAIIGQPHGHPLAEWSAPQFNSQLKSATAETLQSLQAELAQLSTLSTKIAVIFQLEGKINQLAQEDALTRMAAALLLLPDTPASLLATDAFEQTMAQVTSLVPHGKQRNALRAALLQGYQREILQYPAAAMLAEWKLAEASWFLPRWLKQQALVKRLKLLSTTGSVEKAAVPGILQQVMDYQQEQSQLDAASWLPSLLGFTWRNGDPDWQALEETVNLLLMLHRMAANLLPIDALGTWRRQFAQSFAEGSKQFTGYHAKELEAYKTLYRSVTTRLTELKPLVGFDSDSALANAAYWKKDLAELVKRWLDNLHQLRDWHQYRQIREQAMDAGLQPLVSAYESGAFETSELQQQYQKGLYRCAAEWIIDNQPLLTSFNGELFDQKVQRFRELSQQFQQLTREELQARLAAKIPSFSQEAAQSSEIGILQRALRSNGRGTSIRKLFDSIPNLLPRLTPCMLMSPISVAQYFELGKFQFDLVIFDEASQLPTCEAVGAIARAANVIVVGDPKQMPPTNFFTTNQVDEENLEKEDLESILDDCLALSMPSQYLLWHYRSQHESLIAFSNANYYENKLLTFPSPDDIHSRVRQVPVNGVYDRSNTRQNRVEAEAIVQEVVRRLSDPELSRSSMGIVTFSSVQQILIDDLLDKVFATRPDLEKKALEQDEPLFIKNLENVQGDERDVILFSVCYGPDAEGKISMNFGPINRDGGWRRLNVAVSRARQEMIVFSSLRSDQLDLRRTASEGVANLKAFLAYAEKGRLSLAVNTHQQRGTENGLETVIASALREKGYTVHTQIGSSSYKIDLAVVDPENPKQYLLGILTDGQNYYQANTSRDREIVQVEVLRQLGWQIHKIWSTEWWENPGRVLNRLLALLETIKQGGTSKPVEEPIVAPEPVQEEVYQELAAPESTVAREYRMTILAAVAGGEEFTAMQHQERILNQLEQVLAVEAPISKSLLFRKILGAWGISRLGTRINAHLEQLLLKLNVKQASSSYGIFLWPAEIDAEAYEQYRVARTEADRRAAEDLPPEEVAAAIKEMLANQLSMHRSELIREVAKLFGFARLGPVVEQVMQEGLALAVKRGVVEEQGERVVMK